MKLENAIKKLEGFGYTVKETISQRTQKPYMWLAQKTGGKDVIEFMRDDCDGLITCIRVRGTGDHDDVMTDYFAGVFVDNLSQALKIAN